MLTKIKPFEVMLLDGKDWVINFTQRTPEPELDPVLLVSMTERKAYLRRAPGTIYEFQSVSLLDIDGLRRAPEVFIMEWRGTTIARAYIAPAALLEIDNEDDRDEKAISRTAWRFRRRIKAAQTRLQNVSAKGDSGE